MKTNGFSTGLVTIVSVKPFSTSFAGGSKYLRTKVNTGCFTLDSSDHKNISILIDRKTGLQLAKELNEMFKVKKVKRAKKP